MGQFFIETFKAAVSGATAYLGTFQDLPKPPPPVEIVEITNAENETSKIAIFTNEGFDAYRIIKPSPDWLSVFVNGNNRDYADDVQKTMLENGFDIRSARTFADHAAYRYAQSSGYKSFSALPIMDSRTDFDRMLGNMRSMGPHARGADRINYGEVTAMCGVFQLSSRHNGDQWMSSFLNGKMPHPAVRMPEEYGDLFSRHVRFHEIAHCMGADERAADYVAGLMLLKSEPDTERTKDFLSLFAAARTNNALYQPASDYDGTAQMLGKAVNDFTQSAASDLSEAQIWSLAKSNSAATGNTVREAIDPIMKSRAAQTMLENRDYAGLASFVTNFSEGVQDNDKEIYNDISDSLQLLSRIVSQRQAPTSQPHR